MIKRFKIILLWLKKKWVVKSCCKKLDSLSSPTPLSGDVGPDDYKESNNGPMKLYLQYTSHLDREHIKEAAKLKDAKDAVKKGWKSIGNGAYKTAYKKDNIVVKFNLHHDNMHMLKELILYRDVHRKYKKHLARIFGGNGRKIIQRFVEYDKDCKYTNKDHIKVEKIAQALGLFDCWAGHNAIKTKDNEIIIFDFSGHTLTNI